MVRAYEPRMSFEDAAKLLMVSFDSTSRPISRSACRSIFRSSPPTPFISASRRGSRADDPFYNEISRGWGNALKTAFKSLPEYSIQLDPE
jgi:putative proteasome-type protease